MCLLLLLLWRSSIRRGAVADGLGGLWRSTVRVTHRLLRCWLLLRCLLGMQGRVSRRRVLLLWLLRLLLLVGLSSSWRV